MNAPGSRLPALGHGAPGAGSTRPAAAGTRPRAARGGDASAVSPAPAGSDEARLRKTAQQLESVFVEQLYKAMRATVPQDEGVVSGGNAEEMFTGLMDQHLAADTPTQWDHGLADAIYRQLRGRLQHDATASAAEPAVPDVPTDPARALPPSSDPSGR